MSVNKIIDHCLVILVHSTFDFDVKKNVLLNVVINNKMKKCCRGIVQFN